MRAMYLIGNYIGYFLVMLIFLTLAVIFAKKAFGWLLYTAGAVIQLFSLIGNQRNLSMFGLGSTMTGYWIVYFLLLCVGAALICVRRRSED